MSPFRTPAVRCGGQLSQVEKAAYGAARSAPSPTMCCLMFGNIQGFPSASSPERADAIKHILLGTNALLFSEHNSSHLRNPIMQRIAPTSYDKFFTLSSNLTTAYDEPPATGGTGFILDSTLSKFILSHGSDQRGLGRWTWTSLRGRSNKIVTLISVYRSEPGWASYTSQLAAIRHLWTLGDETLSPDTDPSKLFLEDLSSFLRQKLTIGSVIVGGDFNDDLHVLSGPIQTLMRSLHLVDSFRQYHPLPAHTHARGSDRRIDGIFSNLPIRAGYYDFDVSPSDHMWMFAEISFDILLNIQSPNFPVRPKQRATSKNPIVMNKYNILLNKQCTLHHIKDKLSDLEDMLACDAPLSLHSTDLEALHDQITAQVYQAMQYANKHCRKIREGPHPFSADFKRARIHIRFLKLLYRRVHPKYRSPTKSRVQRFASLAKYRGSLSIPHAQVSELLTQAKRHYKSLIPSLYNRRKAYYIGLAQAKSHLDGRPAETHLRQILHRERNRKEFRAIRYAVGKVKGPPLVAIEKDTPTGRILIIDDVLRDREIIKCHKAKLMAANNTPLRQLPISSILGEHGDFEKWNAIANKDLHLPVGVDSTLQEWYTYLQSTMPSTPPMIQWTEAQYSCSWKLMKEETGTGPGPSFACIKSIHQGSIPSKALSVIALVPLQIGFVPRLWQNCTEQCIPKKVNDLRPQKLRRITLFNAQLNHNKKFLGKQMMAFGETKNLLAPEQYGSRHGKSSIIHALNKRLVFDWMRLSHTPGIYVANDAKGCYDRIILLVAYLTMRRMNIPHEAAKFSVSCLLEMVYRVRTAWGVSDETYGGPQWLHEFNKIPHGAGQGSGDGPPLWAGISSPLFDLMRSNGHCFHLESSITSISLVLAGFSFVDDTDYVELLPPTLPLSALHLRAQKSINKWEKLIRTTGGALEPSKSDWVWIQQRWKNGRWEYIDPPTPPLTMASPSGQINPLTRLDVEDSRLTLGVSQTPIGDEHDQVQYLSSKISDWCNSLLSSVITHRQVQQAVSITINATVTYALPSTCFNPAQCKTLENHLRKTALPRMGIVRTAAKPVVYGPKAYGGMGLLSIRLAQTIAHIRVLIHHGGTPSIEGKLIQILLESSILEAGYGTKFFNLPPNLPWMSISWLWQTIQEVSHFNFRIQAPAPLLHPWRANDSYIMEGMFKSIQTSAETWRRLNHVRCYLQVITISDIADNCGTRLLPSVLRCEKHPSISSSAYTWPRMPPTLTHTDILTWRTHIVSTFLINPTSLALRPQFRVSHWLPKSLAHTQWWQSPSGCLFKSSSTRPRQWIHAPYGRNTRNARRTYVQGLFTTLPPACIPVMIQPFDPVIKCSPSYTPMVLTPTSPNSRHWSLHTLSGMPADLQKFAHLLATGKAQLLSDGSFKDEAASSSFLCITLPDVGGTNIVPGHPVDMSAHRGEMAGVLGQIHFANHICTTHNITSGSVVGATDCINAVRFANDPYLPSTDTSCYDLCDEIFAALRASPLSWTFKYVPGHQDDTKAISELNIWERANVLADRRAKDVLAHWRAQGSPPVDFPSNIWGVSIGNTPMRTSKVSIHLSESQLAPPLQEYWLKRLKIPDLTLADVSWPVIRRTMTQASPAHRRFRSKHIAHISATGINLVRRRQRETDKCPHCGQPEDNLHVYVCPSAPVKNLFQVFTPLLHTHLVTSSDSDLVQALQFLFQWSRAPPLPLQIPPLPVLLSQAVENQMDMGILAFQWGFYSPLLINYLHNRWTNDRRSATVWFSDLSTLLWRHLQDLWILRNTTLHSPSNAVKEAESITINIDITDLLEELSTIPLAFIPSPDRRFLQTASLTAILARSLISRRTWLRQARKISNSWRVRRDSNPDAQMLREWLLTHPPNRGPPETDSDTQPDDSDTD